MRRDPGATRDREDGIAVDRVWIGAARGWLASPVRNALLLGQNYHLIHHLWTTIPWYRYQPVFRTLRDELAARGNRLGAEDGARPAALSQAT